MHFIERYFAEFLVSAQVEQRVLRYAQFVVYSALMDDLLEEGFCWGRHYVKYSTLVAV